MRRPVVVAVWLGVASMACSGGSSGGGSAAEPRAGGGKASVTIAGRPFEISDVQLHYELGEDGSFRIDGEDAAHPNEDCVSGLSGGLALYGTVPASVTSVAALAGQELSLEFSGDGDDANLCFVGSGGLLGVQSGTVRFTSVEGDRVGFSFSGRFMVYDGKGGESGPVEATGSGTAVAMGD